MSAIPLTYNIDPAPYITNLMRDLEIRAPSPLHAPTTNTYIKARKPRRNLFDFRQIPNLQEELRPIRERIYHYALVVDKIVIHGFPLHKYVGQRVEKANLALLRASKKVNAEAEKIFYGENTFVIMTGLLMAAQVRANPCLEDKFLMIRRLEIVYDYRDWAHHYENVYKSVPEEIAALGLDIESGRKAGDWMGVEVASYSRQELLKEFDIMTSKKLIKRKMKLARLAAYHDDQVRNMGIFCYGHAMDFAREHLKLDYLTLDYQNLHCFKKCCHLAIESTTWGNVKGWKHGRPRSIVTWGTKSREERKAIVKAIMDKDEKDFKCKSYRLKRRP